MEPKDLVKHAIQHLGGNDLGLVEVWPDALRDLVLIDWYPLDLLSEALGDGIGWILIDLLLQEVDQLVVAEAGVIWVFVYDC